MATMNETSTIYKESSKMARKSKTRKSLVVEDFKTSKDFSSIRKYNKYVRSLSPSKFIRYRFYQSIKTNDVKRKRVKPEEFRILNYGEEEELLSNNYNVSQLKMMAKKYRCSTSGNKDELLSRVYNTLSLGNKARVIQSYVRRHFVKIFLRNRGIKYFKYSCVNDCDFYSLDSLADIPIEYFCAVTEKNNDKEYRYGFDIRSLKEYIKTQKNIKNPYTNTDFQVDVATCMKQCLHTAKVLGYNIKKHEIKEPKQKTENNIQDLLHEIDNLGHLGSYTDIRWYQGWNQSRIIQYIHHLYDILTFRMSLTQDIQREICGNNSHRRNCLSGYTISQIYTLGIVELKKVMQHFMNVLIMNGVNEDRRKIGSIIVIMATTLVNSNARTAFPGLYESAL